MIRLNSIDFGKGTGSVVLRFRCLKSAVLRLKAAGKEYEFHLPSAKQWREQLFVMDPPVCGIQDAAFDPDDGIELDNWHFHQAEEVVTGRNPLTGMDFPDVDVIRVGDVYYMISTTMYFMPGAVILRSYDLIHWEYCTRIYDVLDDTPGQRLEEGNAYSAGMWAATLRYHQGTFYVVFVANDTKKTYLYRAENIMGPWKKSIISGFYHDCSLLFDDDGRIYLVYGGTQIHLLELDSELTGPKDGGIDLVIADSGPSDYLGYEGSHLYKFNGKYYLFVIHSRKDRWRRVESCLMSDCITGPYQGGIILDDDAGLRDDGVAQGGVIDTPDGRWYAIMFQDTGAVGRIPLLMPMTWENDFPVLGVEGKVPLNVCNLTTRPGYAYAPLWDSDDFASEKLRDMWEWNHIPHLEDVSIGGGAIRMKTSRTDELLTQTRNMLTQRSVLPACAAEVTLDISGMQTGDAAGLCALQSRWGWIGLKKEEDGNWLTLRMRLLDDPEQGVEYVRLPWEGEQIRLRVEMYFSSQKDEAVYFFQSDGKWRPMGERQPLHYLLDHFTGYRFALFVQSSLRAGGEAAFSQFRLSQLTE